MAYNISNERLMVLLIKDPAYCMFYHRARVQELLPVLARSHLLVTKLEDEITERLQREDDTTETTPIQSAD